MKFKTVLLCACAVLCNQTSLVWGGPILKAVSVVPSDLNTPLSTQGKSKMVAHIGCADAYTGNFISCDFDFSITGLTQPDTNPANNGGHTHDYSSHPLGTLQETWPTLGQPTPAPPSDPLKGNTRNNWVLISHEIPNVSGKIETVMNLIAPPGYIAYPISCNGDYKSMCFNTTVDVGVEKLKPLPDNPSLYTKLRSPDVNHTNAVAFYGTDSALRNLNKIAYWYKRLLQTLSVNDMSLIKGGLFDADSDYLSPHSWHRTGESVDINKTENGDCKKNIKLLVAVYLVMGRGGQPAFANRQLPSFGHFLCETNRKNNIHIDL